MLLFTNVFAKDNESLENRRQVEHESGVVPEAFDVTLVAGVEENWSIHWIKPTVLILE